MNISYPANGTNKLIDIDDERKVRVFMDKRMGNEVPGDSVGDEFKGYIFRITGGNDKQGFPMKQGVLHPTRVRLLLRKVTLATVHDEREKERESLSEDVSPETISPSCLLQSSSKAKQIFQDSPMSHSLNDSDQNVPRKSEHSSTCQRRMTYENLSFDER